MPAAADCDGEPEHRVKTACKVASKGDPLTLQGLSAVMANTGVDVSWGRVTKPFETIPVQGRPIKVWLPCDQLSPAFRTTAGATAQRCRGAQAGCSAA